MRLLEKLKTLWRRFGGAPDLAKSFRRDQQQERAFDTIDRGTQRIPLDRIVGSVGRYQDFDSQFRPKQHISGGRYDSIKQALRQGQRLPPVMLYQIKDEYYVLDGNHRIAAAKELGQSDVAANIVEFIPSKDNLEGILFRQRARFSEASGLPYAITLTEIGQYDHLLAQISRHREHLDRSGKKGITLREAAADWYDTIYRPLSAIIRKGDLLKFFPNRTMDDLYAYISLHQWEEGRKRRYGIGIDRLIPNNMEAFRDKMATQCKTEYPEMLRRITAFVLMNLRAKNEDRILEKLFALQEVQEVHSIHGNVDVLIKVVLTRDMLSSDAEIIHEFVNDHIRVIPGVQSTQTMIPGRSMIKNQDWVTK